MFWLFTHSYQLGIEPNLSIVIFGIISISVNDITLFLISRHMVSFGLGLSISCTSAIVAENINKEYRGFCLNFIIISAALGELIISFSLGSLIDSADSSQWRNLLFISTLPVYLLYFYIYIMFIIKKNFRQLFPCICYCFVLKACCT